MDGGPIRKSVSDVVPERYPESKGAFLAGCRRALPIGAAYAAGRGLGAGWRSLASETSGICAEDVEEIRVRKYNDGRRRKKRIKVNVAEL